MTLLLPGLVSQRQTRSSRLAFAWRASDGSIDPYTGQLAAFDSTPGSARGPVLGVNGVSVTGGSAMPRFMYDTDGITRLEMRGDSASFDVEQLGVGLTLPVQAISILVRVKSMYTKGSDVGTAKEVFTWGTDAFVGGGIAKIRRRSTLWEVGRDRQGSNFTSSVTEPAGITYPVDVMLTVSAAGALICSTRDAAGVIATGSASTNAAMVTAGETLSTVGLFCSSVGTLTGGWWRGEAVKIARGVQTFAAMDLLS